MSHHDQAESSAKPTSRLFDLRTIIGFLFAVYGIVCLIWGLVSFTPADDQKAGGINVNLWSGIGMILLGASFLIWSFARPLEVGAAGPEASQSEDGRSATASTPPDEGR
jgi:hypothetical protein